MKKTVILMLLVCMALPVFADDALVLPAGVFRLYLVPSYGFAPGSYDKDGSYTAYKSGQGEVTAFNAGLALEYGVNDWIAAAVQWTPGWNISSSLDIPAGTSNVNVNGLYDLFIGAKVQLVGEKAPAKSDTVRFCAALGVTVPLGGANFKDQATNAANGKDFTYANVDKQTLGLGGRIYFDYIFSKAFFLNLYSQIILYPWKEEFKNTSLPAYQAYKAFGINPDVGYGYDFTLELEPHYTFFLSDGVQLEPSLPFTLTYTPNITFDGTSQPDTSASLIVIRPTLDLFLLKSLPVPIEFKLAYSLPLIGWGNPEPAMNAIIFIVRIYFKV